MGPLSSFDVKAEDCASVNLLTTEDSPFQKIPLYNQENLNICYAYTAAQMSDYHLLKNGAATRNVHPAWVAALYASSRERKTLEIGHTKEALEQLQLAANCDYQKVTDALKNISRKENESENRAIKGIELAYQRSPSSLNPVQSINKLLNDACPVPQRQKLKLPTVAKYNFKNLPDDKAFENFLKLQLGRTPSPISITYCSNIWKNPDYAGIKLNDLNLRDRLARDCHYHESLVVGQKMVGNSCNFLIRNTWGSRWSADNKNWNCLCKNKLTQEFSDDCRPETHPDSLFEVQACWLPGEKIARNTGQITFLQ